MSKRNQHIEDWLRQAAAQAPEVSPDQLKQQAWGQLSNMLDKGEPLPDKSRSSGSGWWTIVVEAIILVGAFTYVQVQRTVAKRDIVVIADNTHHKELNASFVKKEAVLSFPSDTITADVLIKEHGLSPLASKEQYSLLSENIHLLLFNPTLAKRTTAAPDEHAKPAAGRKHTSSRSSTSVLPSRNTDPDRHSRSRSAITRKKQTSPRPSTRAVYWNTDPLEKTPSGPEQKRLLRYAGAGSREAIRPLFTKQLFVPVKDSGVQHTPAPQKPRSIREHSEYSPYSLKIAAILPIADAYGAAASIEYVFQWREKWRIRPYIGAEYLTGINKVYDHRYYAAFSPGGGQWSQGNPARTDSILTHFSLKGITYAKAGVQAVYVFSKWEIAAGIEYRHVLNVSGKDTTFTITRPLVLYPVKLQYISFNKKQITGSGNLRLQLGLDYTISPRLQIGATYYMQLNRQKLDSSYRSPAPELPDQSSFQLHLRYRFMRKPPR